MGPRSSIGSPCVVDVSKVPRKLPRLRGPSKIFEACWTTRKTSRISRALLTVTFMIRPRVAGPTGMVMGAPVSVALAPRVRPSVPSYNTYQPIFRVAKFESCFTMAMQRTTFSPRCCETSRTSFWPLFSTWRASRILGRFAPSNLTTFDVRNEIDDTKSSSRTNHRRRHR